MRKNALRKKVSSVFAGSMPLLYGRIIVRLIGIFLIYLILYSLIGCAPSLSKRSDEELKTFLADLKKRTEQHASAKAGRLNEGIRKFSVEKAGTDFRISIDLVDASLPVVLERLFHETSIPHVFRREVLAGKVTARFDNLSLMEGRDKVLKQLDRWRRRI